MMIRAQAQTCSAAARTMFLLLVLISLLPAAVFAGQPGEEIIAGVPAHFPPQYSTNPMTGRPTGFAIDVLDAIARRSGVTVRYTVFDSWQEVLQALRENRIDVIPNMGVTPERAEFAGFTTPLETFHIQIFVRSSTDDINGIDNLADRAVAVVSTNKGLFIMQQRPGVNLKIYDAIETALMALVSGDADALIYPREPFEYIARESGLDKRLKAAGKPLLEVKRAIGVRKDRPELLARLDAAVKTLLLSPDYKNIYQKWHAPPAPFWNTTRTAMTMGALLAFTILFLLIWRYRSIILLNRELKHLNAELTAALEVIGRKEEELRNNDERYALAQRAAKIGCWDWDIAENRLRWSELVEPMFGLEKGSFKGTVEDFLRRVHADDRQAVKNAIDASMSQKGGLAIEYRVVWPDGTVRWIAASGEVIRDADQHPVRMLGVCQDITENKQSDQAIQALVESTVGTTGRECFDKIVAGLCRLLNADCVILAEIRDDGGVAEAVAMQLDGEKLDRFHYTLSGSPCHVPTEGRHCIFPHSATRLFPEDQLLAQMRAEGYVGTQIRDRNGAVIGILSAISRQKFDLPLRIREVMDIIATRAAAEFERMRDEEMIRKYTQIISCTHDLMSFVDKHYIYRAVNDSYLAAYGRRREDIIGHTVAEVRGEDFFANEIQQRLDRALQGEEVHFEAWADYPAKGRRFVNVAYSPFFEKDNSISGVVISARDLTNEKRLMQEAEQRLQQVIQADKLAALGQVVAGVAHEINNPNSFITYNIPLLEETWQLFKPVITEHMEEAQQTTIKGHDVNELCQDMDEIITAINTGSARINTVVNNLKDFSRIEDSTRVKQVQVNEVIGQTLTIVGAQLRKSFTDINVNLAEDLPEIHGHFQKLEQVVANLLINAANAVSDNAAGRLSITSRYLDEVKAVLVDIEDNGEGISPEVMEQIFEPFFTTRRDRGGTGLGLSVSYRLIQEHKGRIAVLSRPGAGTRFTVLLPLDRRQVRFDLLPTVLCVDDDVRLVNILGSYSMKANRIDGEAGIDPAGVAAYLERHPEVDVVVTDIDLPGMNGWELLRNIKMSNPLLRIIFCSGNSTTLKAFPHRNLPDALVEKPVNPRKLVETIAGLGRIKI